MHIEEGFDWDLRLDRQMSTCKRAMQRDKGPEQRAKEVRVTEIPDKTWNLVNKKEKEPKRVAWSYAWAAIWMFRAIEAAQISAQDVVVKVEEKIVKHFIPKSKTDQRGMGTWRTLKCCGQAKCERSCPFAMAVDALNDLGQQRRDVPTLPRQRREAGVKDPHGDGVGRSVGPRNDRALSSKVWRNGLRKSRSQRSPHPVPGQMEILGSVQIHRGSDDRDTIER